MRGFQLHVKLAVNKVESPFSFMNRRCGSNVHFHGEITGSVYTAEWCTLDTVTQPLSVHTLACARSLVRDKHLSPSPPAHSLGSWKTGKLSTNLLNKLQLGCVGCQRQHPALTLRGSKSEAKKQQQPNKWVRALWGFWENSDSVNISQ